jgi:hypothetical protein
MQTGYTVASNFHCGDTVRDDFGTKPTSGLEQRSQTSSPTWWSAFHNDDTAALRGASKDGVRSRSTPTSLKRDRTRGWVLQIRALPPTACTRRTEPTKALRPTASIRLTF